MGSPCASLYRLACLPAFALVTWTRAADHAKERSILGNHNTSSNLHAWNFATPEHARSPETWSVLANRINLPLGAEMPFVIAAVGLVVARRRLAEVCMCVFLYLIDILTFTNLYYVHSYYYFANNIFLIVAIGMVIVAMIESDRRLRDIAIAGLLLLLGLMGFDYRRTYQPIQANNMLASERLGIAIRDHTEPEDVIVLLGFDWSSEVPYYSRRRALCLPNWVEPGQVGPCLRSLKSYHIGAVVVAKPSQKPIPYETVLSMLREDGFYPKPSPVDAPFQLLLQANATGSIIHAAKGRIREV